MTGFRSRSLGSMIPTCIYYDDKVAGGGKKVAMPAGQRGTIKGITEMCVDGWLGAIRNGQILVNELDRTIISETGGNGTWSQITPRFQVNCEYTGDFGALVRNSTPAPAMPATDVRTSCRDIAHTSVMAKAYSGATLALESLAQLAETVGMLRRPFASTSKLLSKLYKKRNYLKATYGYSATTAAADAWLEYRYGWKPLILDISSVLQAICEQRNNLTRRLVFRAGSYDEREVTSSFSGRPLPGDFYYLKANGSYTVRKSCRASAGVICEVRPRTPLETFEKVFGLGANDIPVSLWAMMPFSFIVDWFVNVEDWIRAVTPDPNVQILGSWITDVETASIKLNAGSLSGNYYWQIEPPLTGSYDTREYLNVRIRREPNPLTWTQPSLQPKPLTVERACDTASLLAGSIIQGLEGLRH